MRQRMVGNSREEEADCSVEASFASASHVEDVSEALAEEIETCLEDGRLSESQEVAVAEELIRELRLLGSMVAMNPADLGRASALGQLLDRANDLVCQAPRHTPPAGVDMLPSLLDFDGSDEQTAVKRPSWEWSRNTNRVLTRK